VTALVLTPKADLSVSLAPDAITTRDDAVGVAKEITAITDDLDLEIAADALRNLKHLAREVETSRIAVKAPVLKLGRQIDDTAAQFVATVVHETVRIERLLSDYHATQRRLAAEAERARQAEADRLAAEAVNLRHAAEAAEAARLAALAADRDAAERDMLGQKVRQAELDGIAARRITAEQQAAALAAQQARLAAATTALEKPVAAPSRPAGMVVRDVWKFEVLDIWAVPGDFVRIQPNAEAIYAALRAGVEAIPGLRVWKETRAGVR
jgi:uncharacterized protein YfcZ (UPF0381/DUF406 family)